MPTISDVMHCWVEAGPRSRRRELARSIYQQLDRRRIDPLLIEQQLAPLARRRAASRADLEKQIQIRAAGEAVVAKLNRATRGVV